MSYYKYISSMIFFLILASFRQLTSQLITQIIFLLALAGNVHASDFKMKARGEFRFESRTFLDDHNFKTQDYGTSMYSHLESKMKKGNLRGDFGAYSRVDSQDQNRSNLFIEDFWISLNMDDDLWKLKFGLISFNWSATEIFHPADIVNSTSFDSDFEHLEKIGELTLELQRSFDQSTFRFFLFPYFSSPIFPSIHSRLGTGVKINDVFIIDANGNQSTKKWLPQFGVKYDTSFHSLDLSFHYINHIDRYTPIFSLSGSNIHPNYLRVNQFGITSQQAISSILLKFEIVYRDFDNRSIFAASGKNEHISDHSVAAAGSEYTHVNQNQSETTYFVEAQSLFGVSQIEGQKLNIFDRDIFFGLRHNFNDSSGKEIFVGYIRDLIKYNESLFILSYSQRFNQEWKYSSGLRMITSKISSVSSLSSGLEYLNKDSYFYINLSRYF